jgi:hypothetical protein
MLAWASILAAFIFSLSIPNFTSCLSNMDLHMAAPLSSLSLLSEEKYETVFSMVASKSRPKTMPDSSRPWLSCYRLGYQLRPLWRGVVHLPHCHLLWEWFGPCPILIDLRGFGFIKRSPCPPCTPWACLTSSKEAGNASTWENRIDMWYTMGMN